MLSLQRAAAFGSYARQPEADPSTACRLRPSPKTCSPKYLYRYSPSAASYHDNEPASQTLPASHAAGRFALAAPTLSPSPPPPLPPQTRPPPPPSLCVGGDEQPPVSPASGRRGTDGATRVVRHTSLPVCQPPPPAAAPASAPPRSSEAGPRRGVGGRGGRRPAGRRRGECEGSAPRWARRPDSGAARLSGTER